MRRRGGYSLGQAIIRRKIKEDIHRIVNEGAWQTAQDMLEVAKQLSSGTVDSNKVGHPYARAHPNPSYDPALINIGVGSRRHPGARFSQSWVLMSQSSGPGLYNNSWIGPFLEQKNGGARSTMVPRPIDRLLVVLIDPVMRRNLDRAFASDGTAGVSQIAA